MTKKQKTAEYGDFQTPAGLARQVCELLSRKVRPASILEPTCGLGSFVFASLAQFPAVQRAFAAEINPTYIEQLKADLQGHPRAQRVLLCQADFFQTDWTRIIQDLPEPLLVVGNLPWVTNAHLSSLGSANVPRKSNFQNHRGMDAITGKANFDISEGMLLKLLDALKGRSATLAMLCKSAVARKFLGHAWRNGSGIASSCLYRINAQEQFGAAVEAVLLVTSFANGQGDSVASVYASLDEDEPESILAWDDGLLIPDKGRYDRWKHLSGDHSFKWRSGVKHDCAKIVELAREGTRYCNGLGELVELEDSFLYPMLKSSDVARGSAKSPGRFMLVTQRKVGEDTAKIQKVAPRTWKYLASHDDQFEKRGSSIYRNRPRFSMFGIGDYTFSPFKVAISGFYKRLSFTVVGHVDHKPIVLDDTSYFLPCKTESEAEFLASLLNSEVAREFYSAFIFWDAKRPITAELLRRLNLRKLSSELGQEGVFDSLCCRPDKELLWQD